MKKLIFAMLCILFPLQGKSQTANIRGMYVDGFAAILGNTQKEDSLLSYAQNNNFNYLALYDLWAVHTTYDLTNFSSSAILANFIQKAKQLYSIAQVGAVGENFYFFNNVINVYNQQHTDTLQKFDVYNVEFEWWNTGSVGSGGYYCTTYLQPASLSCDTAGAFTYYSTLIHQVDSLAHANGMLSELYVGWFTQGQAIAMANSIDRILLHDYISNYSSLYSYVRNRLVEIAARNSVTEIIPLFSAEPSFLGPWLTTHPLSQPFNDLVTAFNNDTGVWKQYIHLNGYQWFAYSYLPASPITSVTTQSEYQGFIIYPVPAHNILSIKNETQRNVSVEIFNSYGVQVYSSAINSSSSQIDLSNQPNGIYYYCARDEQRILKSGKIIVE